MSDSSQALPTHHDDDGTASPQQQQPSVQEEDTIESQSLLQHYEIPSFWDILLQSEFRILHQPPPLQIGETQADRDYIDWLLRHFWNEADSRALLNQQDQEQLLQNCGSGNQRNAPLLERQEFTYGEVTPTGVRQLLEDMELLQLLPDNNTNKEPSVVFYDLGSGEGKLVVQVLLECRHPNTQVIGIELHPARHAMAVQSWNKLYRYLLSSSSLSLKEPHNNNHEISEEPDEMQATQHRDAKHKLQERFRQLHEPQASSNNNNSVPNDTHADSVGNHDDDDNHQLQHKCTRIQLIHGNLLDHDFSNATHIFASSIFFPPDVLEQLCHKINGHALQPTSQIRVVAALSDLTWFEEDTTNEGCCLWEKRVQRLQMTWGGANVRLYFRKDY